MKKLAIIGASYLQEPLIERAQQMGLQTHVFAWKAGDIGERTADFFYPISIVEREEILSKCREIGIDGICSIASDLAMKTVNYVADQMGLTANSLACTELSTNKHAMREAFRKNGDPSPASYLVREASELDEVSLAYPVIVKPLDRSGSRGITRLESPAGLDAAIKAAKEQGFEKAALVEEFATGQEYSVEYVSFRGRHHFLALTEKFTTGAPHFIETGHLEPAPVSSALLSRIQRVTEHALDSLQIAYGASHTELKVADDGTIALIEIGGRMGGDFIGSNLVRYSTGIDFVRAVIQIALGEEPDLRPESEPMQAAVRFVFGEAEQKALEDLRQNHPDWLRESEVHAGNGQEVTDSSTRLGYFLFAGKPGCGLEAYLPEQEPETNPISSGVTSG